MTFTNQSILQTAIEQSAVDLHCSPADFARAEDIVVPSAADPRARRYLTLPFACCLVSYGGNVVASAGEGYRAAADELLRRFGGWQCFEHAHLLLQDAGLEAEDFGAVLPPRERRDNDCDEVSEVDAPVGEPNG